VIVKLTERDKDTCFQLCIGFLIWLKVISVVLQLFVESPFSDWHAHKFI